MLHLALQYEEYFAASPRLPVSSNLLLFSQPIALSLAPYHTAECQSFSHFRRLYQVAGPDASPFLCSR